MRLAWLTDIHLNFLDTNERLGFYQKIAANHCDALLITGDIAEAPSLVNILIEMADQIKKPIYFIMGNHDYYRGQINEMRETVAAFTKMHEQLFWLPASGMQQLNKNTFLVGQDGWADGRLGDYQNSKVSLNDSRFIADLVEEKILGKVPLLKKMQELADADAMQLQMNLMQAIGQRPKKIIILMHVPPFAEACQHNGQISDAEWLPYFSSKIAGEVTLQAAQDNSAIDFLLLCGHTHSVANYQPLPNLVVRTGKAEYGQPELQDIIII